MVTKEQEDRLEALLDRFEFLQNIEDDSVNSKQVDSIIDTLEVFLNKVESILNNTDENIFE